METLDILLRGGALGTLWLGAALFATTRPVGRKGLSVIALCVGLTGYLLVSSAGLSLGPGVLRSALIGVAMLVPVLAYWTALELFLDEVLVAPWQIAVAALIVLSAAASQVAVSLGMLRGLGVLVLFCHLIIVVVQTCDGDLVEARRSFRRLFLIWMVSLGAVITVLEITQADQALPPWVFPVQAGVFWLSAAGFLVWSLRVDPNLWPQTVATPKPASSVEEALIERVKTAMAEGLWRQEGLTVADMARHLSTPEHRLRRAINNGLGHRNFSSFVNAFRIAEAKAILADPAQADRTVLSIAFHVGFSSLGPFNRAFRADTQMSPTEYRAAQVSR